MNHRLKQGLWEKHLNLRTKTGAEAHAYAEPEAFYLHVHQVSRYYQSQGLQREESTHNALTYQKGIKVQDRIRFGEELYEVTSVNEDGRMVLLGLKNASV